MHFWNLAFSREVGKDQRDIHVKPSTLGSLRPIITIQKALLKLTIPTLFLFQFKCCGVTDPEDWGMIFPDSCCDQGSCSIKSLYTVVSAENSFFRKGP